MFHCVVSSQLLNEYRNVVARPRLAKSFLLDSEDVESLLNVLFETADMVVIPSHYSFGLRDLKDEMVIATAIAGNADYIVSGDRDLLEFDLSPHSSSLRVVTATVFIELLQSSRE